MRNGTPGSLYCQFNRKEVICLGKERMSSVKRNSVGWVKIIACELPIPDLFLISCYRRRTLIASTASFSWLSAVESFSSDTSPFWKAFVLERVGVKVSQVMCSEASSPGQQLLSSEKVWDWVLRHALQDDRPPLPGWLQRSGHCLRKILCDLGCVHSWGWWLWYSSLLWDVIKVGRIPLIIVC